MPNFFMPFATTPEMAEEAYVAFAKNSEPHGPQDTSRLFRIDFPYHKKPCVAEIGKEIKGWPGHDGEVLAIIESTTLILIHTVKRGALQGGPILVSPKEASGRVYFDDFPVPS